MKKTVAIKNFQELIAREIRKEAPENSSEVLLRPIGKNLISAIKKISSQSKKEQ